MIAGIEMLGEKSQGTVFLYASVASD